MRELAGWDVSQYPRIVRWPIREALLSYEQKLKREAREDYQQELLQFSAQAAWMTKQERERSHPKLPPILKD